MDTVRMRRRTAQAYACLATAAAGEVVLQGFLFSAFFAKGGDWITVHGMAGELTGYLVVALLVPLAFAARFPSSQRIGLYTVALGVAWNVQAHLLGYGVTRFGIWVDMIHVPFAFVVLGLSAYLAVQSWRAVRATDSSPAERQTEGARALGAKRL